MKTPPYRIAVVALVLLVLAGEAAWWLQSKGGVAKPAAVPGATVGLNAPNLTATLPLPAFDDGMGNDPATRAEFAQCQNDLLELLGERAGQLAVRQDATSQLAYALTANMVRARPAGSSQGDATRRTEDLQGAARRAFARAGEFDPGDPDIAWLAADQCFDRDSCEAIQQIVLRSEPDNIAAWLRAMAWARRRGDAAAVEAAFHRAASASRYDTHKGSGVLAVLEGYAGLPTPGACQDPGVQALARRKSIVVDAATFVQMIGAASQIAGSMSFTQLLDFCKLKRPTTQTPERRAGCVHIYSAMANDQSPLERAVALSQLVELTGDTPAGLELRERYRQVRWMLEQGGKLRMQPDFVDMATSEVAAIETALRREGRWPPPADWLPGDERSRSLIKTGRPSPERH